MDAFFSLASSCLIAPPLCLHIEKKQVWASNIQCQQELDIWQRGSWPWSLPAWPWTCQSHWALPSSSGQSASCPMSCSPTWSSHLKKNNKRSIKCHYSLPDNHLESSRWINQNDAEEVHSISFIITSFLHRLDQGCLLGDTFDVNLDVGKWEALEVHLASDHIRGVHKCLVHRMHQEYELECLTKSITARQIIKTPQIYIVKYCTFVVLKAI